ncbi:hypothetical protein K6M89_05035 [Rhizobium sp. 13T]|uniref:Uncharacterized protein n=1 Tax=Rhizobium croatiense TaxID=2867516 RepID=A0ABS7LVT6_9HYPH|nr:hypothetical protein [Rhizobium croatiense]
MPITLVQRLQRFKNLVIGNGSFRPGVKAKSRYGFDREDIGCPGSENSPLFVIADVRGGQHVTRVNEMFRRMEQMRRADRRRGLLLDGIADVFLSHSLAPLMLTDGTSFIR